MKNIGDVIDAFGGPAKMAEAIGEAANLISQWRRRDSIPGEHWRRIVDAARDLRVSGITYQALADLAARKLAA